MEFRTNSDKDLEVIRRAITYYLAALNNPDAGLRVAPDYHARVRRLEAEAQEQHISLLREQIEERR